MGFFENLFGKKQDDTNTSTTKQDLTWAVLNDSTQLTQIVSESELGLVAIFKHSTRCSISTMAKHRLERDWDLAPNAIKVYYLDLLRYRHISNQIATDFGVIHESPQLIVLDKGEVVYHASHSSINAAALAQLHG